MSASSSFVPIPPVSAGNLPADNSRLVPTDAAVIAESLTKQRSFSRGLRAPAVRSELPNQVAKPPRSFTDLRMAAAVQSHTTATMTNVPDADWLARISGSGVQQAAMPTAGGQRHGATRKWVKNLPQAKPTAVAGISRLEVSEDVGGRDVQEDEDEEEMMDVFRPKPSAAECLEQLKFSTKSILDQHR